MTNAPLKSHQSPCMAIHALSGCYIQPLIPPFSPTCSTGFDRTVSRAPSESPQEARARYYRWLPRGRARREELTILRANAGILPIIGKPRTMT